jgi:hypothetical protein
MKAKVYVNKHDFFITYKTTDTAVISFVFSSWIILSFLKFIYRESKNSNSRYQNTHLFICSNWNEAIVLALIILCAKR